MKKFIPLFLLLCVLITGCETPVTSVSIEQNNQEKSKIAINTNQPPPDLGGWSFERHILTQVYLARNRTISTYTYMVMVGTGQIVEICPSIGYPIPYSTQLTNPEQIADSYSQGGFAILPNPEPNGLFPPTNADATIVNCVNDDGTVSPQYVEDRVFSLTYRIRADRVLERVDGENSFKLDMLVPDPETVKK